MSSSYNYLYLVEVLKTDLITFELPTDNSKLSSKAREIIVHVLKHVLTLTISGDQSSPGFKQCSSLAEGEILSQLIPSQIVLTLMTTSDFATWPTATAITPTFILKELPGNKIPVKPTLT
ncbi:unnamed protein product [Allacma fusca]|uniref:Uncharacterized protein n=1 Tax=Allacma fusca TaxID=39272 RepID=A0A8J2PJD1_9HEXA|nr:unnamed protein product [Allacma fusca]